MKILLSEYKEKHSKLILRFEKEWGLRAIWNNKITGNFKHWLRQKIKYKDGFICEECNREFESKGSLARHINWHNKEYRESHTGKNNYGYGKPRSEETKKKIGDKNRGRRGAETSMFGKHHTEEAKKKIRNGNMKENAGNEANHMWIKKYYPSKNICNNKCEICGGSRLDLELARFRHIIVRNIENPMFDYMYICVSCHRIYDKNQTDEQQEKLLTGTTTREEKLKRVRDFILGKK